MSSDSYLSVFVNYESGNVIALFLAMLVRVVPIVSLVPFLGAKVLPAPAKMGLSIVLVLLLMPYVGPMSIQRLKFGLPLVPIVVKEALIGLLIGFLGTIPFNIATAAGAIIDHQRGSASLQVTEPTMQVQTSPIGELMNDVLLVIFFVVGGPFFYFDALVSSFQMIPPEQFIPQYFFATHNAYWLTIIGLMHHIFSTAARFAAPSLVAMLMADVFLGIANRLAPQVQIAFLGMPFKSILGIALLFFGWYFILRQMEKSTMDWFVHVLKLVHVFK